MPFANMNPAFFADAGVPMLFVQMPLLIVALPVVIAVEAALCRLWLEVPWKRAWVGASMANLFSTLAGFPILWIALVIVQMCVGGGSFPKLAEPWYSVYGVTVQAPWLLPQDERLYWMVPTAGMVLLVPAFFVTIFIEKRVYRRVFKDSPSATKVPGATWKMHFVTYGLLLAAGLCLLRSSIARHKGEPGGSPKDQAIGAETNRAAVSGGGLRPGG